MLSLPVESDFYKPKAGKKGSGKETYPNTNGVVVYAPFDGFLDQGPKGVVFVRAEAKKVAPFLPPFILETSLGPVERTRHLGEVEAGDPIGTVFGRNLTSVTEVGDTPMTLETIYSSARKLGLPIKDPGVEDLTRRKRGNPYALIAFGCLSAASITLLLWGKSK